MKENLYTGAELRAIRKKLGLIQTDFWGRVGITPTEGSRYELGKHPIPSVIQNLLAIACGKDEEVAAAVKELRGNYPCAIPFIKKDRTIFWGRVEIKQSTGVRYEFGNFPIPSVIQKLLAVIACGKDEEVAAAVKELREDYTRATPIIKKDKTIDALRLRQGMKERSLYTGAELRAIRGELGLNQTDFWGHVGVSQSGGARYELENHPIPPSIQKLLTIVCGSGDEVAVAVKELRGDYTRATPIIRKDKTIDTLCLRQGLFLNQTDFWKKVCVTQASGCRYERKERSIPLPVHKLLVVVYGSGEEVAAMVKAVRAVDSK